MVEELSPHDSGGNDRCGSYQTAQKEKINTYSPVELYPEDLFTRGGRGSPEARDDHSDGCHSVQLTQLYTEREKSNHAIFCVYPYHKV